MRLIKANLQDRMRLRLIDIGQRCISLFGCTSRTAEYRFVFENLPKAGSTILDVGCCDSLLALKLARKGYKVYGIDTRWYSERHPNLTFVQGDVLSTPFPDEFFDAVIAVSTIEHIGLGVYGDPVHENADTMAVREISRILKASGRFIVTIPFVGEYRLATWLGGQERYYDTDSIHKLFDGFQIQAQQFFIGKSCHNWVSVPEEQAKSPDLKWHANVALLLIKEESK